MQFSNSLPYFLLPFDLFSSHFLFHSLPCDTTLLSHTFFSWLPFFPIEKVDKTDKKKKNARSVLTSLAFCLFILQNLISPFGRHVKFDIFPANFSNFFLFFFIHHSFFFFFPHTFFLYIFFLFCLFFSYSLSSFVDMLCIFYLSLFFLFFFVHLSSGCAGNLMIRSSE